MYHKKQRVSEMVLESTFMTQPDQAEYANTAHWRSQAHMPTVVGSTVKIVGGEGPYVIDSDGNRLLDGTAALFLCNVGHTQPKLIEAARAQMEKLEFYHNHGHFVGEPAEHLATRLRELSPIADSKIIFTSGGSDSVDTACKLARLHWHLEGRPTKKYILFRDRAYHGLHAYGTSVAGLDFNREGYGAPSLVPETLRVPWDDIDEVERLIDELGAANIAAFITEPIIGSGGVLAAPDGYFSKLNELARAHDFLIIVDEIITGFGRTGDYWGTDRFGIDADIIVMAKGITSGYMPLGGVQVAPKVWERFFTGADAPIFRHGLTYAGHNTACAVAEANLDLIEELGLVERVGALGRALDTRLQSLVGATGVTEVRAGHGLLAAVQFAPDVALEPVVLAARERGVLVRALSSNAIAVSPPFVLEDRHVDDIVDAIAYGIDRL